MPAPPDRTGKTGSEELAAVVRSRREALGMSRQELADATGIPYPTIAQIETAYRGVSPARLGVIARALELDPKELYAVLASDAATVSETPSAPAPQRDRYRPVGPPTATPASGGPWHANPRFAAASAPLAVSRRSDPATARAAATREARSTPSGEQRRRTEPVVDQVVQLLSALPADVRIEALGEVQSRLLNGIVEERVRHPRRDR